MSLAKNEFLARRRFFSYWLSKLVLNRSLWPNGSLAKTFESEDEVPQVESTMLINIVDRIIRKLLTKQLVCKLHKLWINIDQVNADCEALVTRLESLKCVSSNQNFQVESFN